MERSVYNSREWRALPRDHCAVSLLLGDHAGPCAGSIHRHHLDPDDPASKTICVCNRHHQGLHRVLRFSVPERRRCTHTHRYDWARRECEARLNAA